MGAQPPETDSLAQHALAALVTRPPRFRVLVRTLYGLAADLDRAPPRWPSSTQIPAPFSLLFIFLQTFAIHRSDTDDHEQFPVSLWVALASLYEDDDDGENEDENEEGIAIGIDSVELLLETLSSRLVLFENIEKSDQNKNTTSEREKYIAYYLLGQQLVLSQAVETLKEMAEQ